MTTPTTTPAGEGGLSDEPQNCPQCENSYLAIRTDIYKDKREFVYCDCCGCLADRRVWNRIAALAAQEGDAARYRWLRDRLSIEDVERLEHDFWGTTDEAESQKTDAAIDAAMAKETK